MVSVRQYNKELRNNLNYNNNRTIERLQNDLGQCRLANEQLRGQLDDSEREKAQLKSSSNIESKNYQQVCDMMVAFEVQNEELHTLNRELEHRTRTVHTVQDRDETISALEAIVTPPTSPPSSNAASSSRSSRYNTG